MKKSLIDFYTRLAKGIAAQFGPDCEAIVHDLQSNDCEPSIIAIENGHVTGRNIGDSPSKIVLDSLNNSGSILNDRLAYLSKTKDGKILKSSMIYIRDDDNNIVGIFEINYDISLMLAMENRLKAITGPLEGSESGEHAGLNVSELLDNLIEQSVANVGKPAAIMTKEDKIKAIRFLNDAGAFLITKSGPKVCQFFGISKFTLYSYLDEIKS